MKYEIDSEYDFWGKGRVFLIEYGISNGDEKWCCINNICFK